MFEDHKAAKDSAHTWKMTAQELVVLMDETIGCLGIPWNELSSEYRKVLSTGYTRRTRGRSWLKETEDIQLMFQYFYNISCLMPPEIFPYWIFEADRKVDGSSVLWMSVVDLIVVRSKKLSGCSWRLLKGYLPWNLD